MSETVEQNESNTKLAKLTSGPSVEIVEDILNHIGFGLFQVLMLFFTGFCWTADAMEIILVSIVGKAAYCDLYGENGQIVAPKSSITQYITVGTFLGAFVGAYFFGVLSDVYGRRKGLFILCTFTVVLAFLSAAPKNYWALILIRTFVGMGLGGTHVALSTFTETLPTSGRQGFSIIMQAFFVLGSVIESALAWGLVSVGRAGWRWLLLVSVFPFLILTFTYPFLLESPRWLVANGYYSQAAKVLSKIAKINGKSVPQEMLDRLIPQKDKMGEEQQELSLVKKLTFREVLTQFGDDYRYLGKVLKEKKFLITFLVLLLAWFANGLVYYGLVQIPTQVEPSGTESFPCSKTGVTYQRADYKNLMISNVVDYPGLLFVGIMMLFVGRKFTFSFVMALCFACLVPQAVIILPQYLKQPWSAKTIAGLQYASRASITGAFAVLYVFTPEVFPTQVRTQTTGTNVSMSRLGAVVSPFIAVQMVKNGKASGAFGLFAAFSGAAAILVWLIPFETMGKKMVETKAKGNDRLQNQGQDNQQQEDQSKGYENSAIEQNKDRIGDFSVRYKQASGSQVEQQQS